MAVIFAHYSQYFLTDHYKPWFLGIAQGLLILFFILSGYGISLSLKKRLGSASKNSRAWAGFFLSRALRIYPLYWIALFVTPFFFPDYYSSQSALPEFTPSTVAIFLALPFVKATGQFWFVTTIVQCYLITPILYLLLKRTGLIKYILLNLVALGVLLATTAVLSQTDLYPTELRAILYKGFPFSHVLAFSLGMTLPQIMEDHWRVILNAPMGFIAFPVFAIVVFMTSERDMLFANSTMYLYPLLLFSAFFMVLLSMTKKPRLPFARLLVIPGEYSYPMYLFNLVFLGVLADLHILKNENWRSPLLLIIFLPIYLALCVVLQKAYDFLHRSFSRIIQTDAGISI